VSVEGERRYGLRHATHAAGRNLFTEVRLTNFSDRVDSAALMARQAWAHARQSSWLRDGHP